MTRFNRGIPATSARVKAITASAALVLFVVSWRLIVVGSPNCKHVTSTDTWVDNHPKISSSSWRNQDEKYCQWTIVAGDSNNRIAFEEWLSLERSFTDGRTVQKATRSPLQYEVANGHRCQRWWADDEMLIVHAPANASSASPSTATMHVPRCHVVSAKFMIDQRMSLDRLRANLTNASYCGSELASVPLPEGYKMPPQPDMIWYSAGLWALTDEKRLSCEERFGHVVKAMMQWKLQQGIQRVVWQTSFEINYHHAFNNSVITWDYRCQKQLASHHGIEIADIYSIVHAAGSKQMVNSGDFHLVTKQHLLPHQYLDRCCGGWESYLGIGS